MDSKNAPRAANHFVGNGCHDTWSLRYPAVISREAERTGANSPASLNRRATNQMNEKSKLEKSFASARLWRQEANELRRILAGTGLTEELKWGKPCYTHEGKNICIIQRMNRFLALMFFKGALLKDPDNVLEVQGANSRGGYRMRFTSVRDVAKMAKSVKAYIREAIEVEKAGLKVQKTSDLEYPEELVDRFAEDPELRVAFDKLTPGRKRGYVLHFSDAKQSKTRVARIEKYRSKILTGKGFQER